MKSGDRAKFGAYFKRHFRIVAVLTRATDETNDAFVDRVMEKEQVEIDPNFARARRDHRFWNLNVNPVAEPNNATLLKSLRAPPPRSHSVCSAHRVGAP